MRAATVALSAIVMIMAAGCTATDQGSLEIRCPGADGAIAVSSGQVSIEGVPIRVNADLTGASSTDVGMAFVIEVQLADSPAHPAPSVDCVRIEKADQNAQWDARPYVVHQFFDGSTARIRADGDHGPHWVSGDAVAVTIWLTVATHRYPLALGRQLLHQ